MLNFQNFNYTRCAYYSNSVIDLMRQKGFYIAPLKVEVYGVQNIKSHPIKIDENDIFIALKVYQLNKESDMGKIFVCATPSFNNSGAARYDYIVVNQGEGITSACTSIITTTIR